MIATTKAVTGASGTPQKPLVYSLINRITSIDFLRGVIMIIMALDHTRDYFHQFSQYHDPTDLNYTSPAIFFTRWITHFCAPIFVFLAGTSAYLTGRNKSKRELSFFLLKRGGWLIVLELTLVTFGWFFNLYFSIIVLQVIWVLGISMVLLAALLHLPKAVILSFGILLIVGHNLLDDVHIAGNNLPAFVWSVLHQFNAFQIGGFTGFTAYPVIPWIGVMALGYCFGALYKIQYSADRRKKILLLLGSIGIFLFFVIRYTNVYGDTNKWSVKQSDVYSLLSFVNANKYPPSLLFLLMTLSPAMLFLAFTENIKNKFGSIISTYGRVPLFYYLIHIYILHLLAMLAAQLTGYSWKNMIFKNTWITENPALDGYGFNLVVVYMIWISVVILLYPLCKRYDAYKQTHKEKWWLSYL